MDLKTATAFPCTREGIRQWDFFAEFVEFGRLAWRLGTPASFATLLDGGTRFSCPLSLPIFQDGPFTADRSNQTMGVRGSRTKPPTQKCYSVRLKPACSTLGINTESDPEFSCQKLWATSSTGLGFSLGYSLMEGGSAVRHLFRAIGSGEKKCIALFDSNPHFES